MKSFVLALAMAGSMTFPVLAQDAMSPDTMTCADFSAMESDAQMQTIAGMEAEGGMMSSEGGMMAGDMAGEAMAPEDTATAVAEVCSHNPEMMLGDAMMEAKDN